MVRRPFDLLLIDFYGTITAGDRAAVEKVCGRLVREFDLPMSPKELAAIWGDRFFGLIDQSNHDRFRTLYECEQVSLRETMARYVGEMDPDPFVADLETYWAAPPIHADVVEALERIDLPICCVSNADTAPLRSAMERNGLRFDAVVTSQEVRCYKPEPKIFREALTRMGLAPDRALHIGDSLHSDIAGASRVGIATAWLRRDERIHDIGDSRPDRTLSSLSELPAILSDGCIPKE